MSETQAPPGLLHGVVVAHGTLARALVEAAEHISGVRGAFDAVSNSGCDRGTLEERIDAAVGDQPSVVFVDMAGGSCMLAAIRRLRARPDVHVVTGVNLAMLLEFVFHRDATSADAAARAAAAGGEAIRTT
jgi:mannose/fructose-specific phosphotransferase system component IIA